MKRIFIVHRWEGNPNLDWYPWLKQELEKKGFDAIIPEMPDPAKPKIDSWVNFLKEQVKNVDNETYFVGHSIGCQTILRYLQSLPENTKIGGALFVAGWINLTEEALRDDEEHIADPWIKTFINWFKISKMSDKFTAIFSDDDPFVPLDDEKIFYDKLGAKIIIENKKGHFNGEKCPEILEELLRMLS